MSDLKKNFYQKVVLSCSTRTKEAVDKNEDVQVYYSLGFVSYRIFKQIAMSIMSSPYRIFNGLQHMSSLFVKEIYIIFFLFLCILNNVF